MKQAATTWRGGKWWEVGGGGTAWDSMAYDPQLNLLYVALATAHPGIATSARRVVVTTFIFLASLP